VLIVVFNPDDGHVTGGGHITSPSGALVADPTATGKGLFEFNPKYRDDGTIEGKVDFRLQGVDFRFESTTFDWLVVDRPNAQLSGTGTVNGTGSYGFLLTATDGNSTGGDGTDRFRIKIWDKNAGDAVVYDNVTGAPDDIDTATPQPLGGGNVTIHKAK
jgi:hypothetical protein